MTYIDPETVIQVLRVVNEKLGSTNPITTRMFNNVILEAFGVGNEVQD